MKSLAKSLVVLMVIATITYAPSLKAESEFSSAIIGIGVVVSDLERSLDFYTQVIGMKKVGGFDINEDFGKRSGLSGGIPFHVDVLKLEDRPDASQWKLLSFGKDAAHPLSKHIQDDTGIQYVTINVTNLQPFLDRIKKHGVELLGDTPIPLGSDRHFVLIRDPDGTIVELIGPLG